MKPRSALKILLAVIALTCICGLGSFMVINYRFERYWHEVGCATPMVMPIQGIVRDIETRQPIANAQIIISDLSTQEERCPYYLTQVRLVTDSSGTFRGSAIDLAQQVEITITVAGCEPQSQRAIGSMFAGAQRPQPNHIPPPIPRPAILFFSCS